MRVCGRVQLRSLASVEGGVDMAGSGGTGATVCDARSRDVIHADVAIRFRIAFGFILGFRLNAGSVG